MKWSEDGMKNERKRKSQGPALLTIGKLPTGKARNEMKEMDFAFLIPASGFSCRDLKSWLWLAGYKWKICAAAAGTVGDNSCSIWLHQPCMQ